MIRVPNGMRQLIVNDRKVSFSNNMLAYGQAREESQETFPRRLVWLMSYPNSGTSYTLSNSLAATNFSVATNYVRDSKTRDLLDPVNLPNGPFLLNSSLRCPPQILTKTHCNMKYELDDFARGCRSTRQTTSNGTRIERLYPVDAVSKAVQLVRHPLDNLVARMHHGMRKFRDVLPDWVQSAEEDEKKQFHRWCTFLDRKFGGFAANFPLSPELLALVRSIPCYSDLLHYVNWHNRAGEVIDRLQLPFHVVYFEDYTTRYVEATRELFDFLKLKQVQQPKAFIPGKTYRHYFKESEIRAISEVLWETASPWTRDLLAYYLQSNETVLAITDRIAIVS